MALMPMPSMQVWYIMTVKQIMSNNTTYNGWSNYATWRIGLEMFDGYQDDGLDTPFDLSVYIKNLAEYFIEQSAPEGLARDYAMAFIADVNWYEIAEHLIAEHAEEETEE